MFESVVSSLEQYEQNRLSNIVFSLCSGMLDRNLKKEFVKYRSYCDTVIDDIPYPLLIRIVLPALRIGYDNHRLPYARWVAQFRREIGNAYPLAFEIVGFPTDLEVYDHSKPLLEALALDPSDKTAQEYLLDDLRDSCQYYIADLPDHLMGGVDQFGILLDKFTELAREYGLYEEYANRLAEWRFSYETWQDYTTSWREYDSYRDYLRTEYSVDYQHRIIIPITDLNPRSTPRNDQAE